MGNEIKYFRCVVTLVVYGNAMYWQHCVVVINVCALSSHELKHRQIRAFVKKELMKDLTYAIVLN